MINILNTTYKISEYNIVDSLIAYMLEYGCYNQSKFFYVKFSITFPERNKVVTDSTWGLLLGNFIHRR